MSFFGKYKLEKFKMMHECCEELIHVDCEIPVSKVRCQLR